MTNQALVVGSSGIVGSALSRLLADEGWAVAGLARRPNADAGVTPISADLLDPTALASALAGVSPTHIFLSTWARQASEAENIRVNAQMVRNLLEAVRPAGTVRHVALVTGLKHYLGPFEAYGKGTLPQTPFREEQGGWTSRTSITPRKMSCSPPLSGTASAGACIARTPSPALRWATP